MHSLEPARAPDWLRRAATLMHADLARYGVELTVSADFEEGELWLVQVGFDGTLRAEFEFFPEMDPARNVVRLARRIQEEAFETTLGSWPPCQEHHLPLELETDPGPVWVCPLEPSLVIPLGELPLHVVH